METQKCTFTKIGEFERNGMKAIVFFNEELESLDYFFKADQYQTVDCFTLNLDNAKRIFNKVNSIEKMKEHHRILWSIACSSKSNFGRMTLQTFPISFWEDAVLKGFDGMKIQAVRKEDAEKLMEEMNKKQEENQ